MKLRRISVGIATACTCVGLAAGTASATTYVLRPANTKVTAKLTSKTKLVFKGTFNGLPESINCTGFTTSGKTPANGLNIVISPPKFSRCHDSLGGKDTIKTNSKHGKWEFRMSAPKNKKVSATLAIPKQGASVTSSAVPGCTLIAGKNGPTSVKGSYNNINKITDKNAKFAVGATGSCTVSKASLTSSVSLSPHVKVVKK